MAKRVRPILHHWIEVDGTRDPLGWAKSAVQHRVFKGSTVLDARYSERLCQHGNPLVEVIFHPQPWWPAHRKKIMWWSIAAVVVGAQLVLGATPQQEDTRIAQACGPKPTATSTYAPLVTQRAPSGELVDCTDRKVIPQSEEWKYLPGAEFYLETHPEEDRPPCGLC